MTRFTRSMLVALAVSALPVAPARAGGLRELDQTIFGMDCAPCAAGIEKGIRRLDGVRSVRVSLNEGKAVVTLAPESRTRLIEIREVIRHNGFTPKEARATLVGRVALQGGRMWLETANGRFVLEAGDARLESDAMKAGSREEVTVLVLVPERLTEPPVVRVIAPQNGN